MLSRKELLEIKELKQRCEKEDHIQLKLNEDLLQMDNPEGLKVYRKYHDESLIGFLGVYGFGSTAEVCGMVHPDHRRQGIFKSLFSDASGFLTKSLVDQVLLNSPSESAAGKGFLSTLPCTYHFTEYQMKWQPQPLTPSDRAVIRKALPNDKELEIQLDVEAFGSSREDAEHFWRQLSNERSQLFYIIEHEGVAVGKLRIHRADNQLWIYGFSILPDYQGKGIGRSALQQVLIKESASQREIHLEVQADHKHTLELYQSCGFEVYHAQDYYQYQM